MANDGQIVFEVTADGKHAIANIKDITAAIQKETKNWDAAADQSASKIGNSFSGMLKKLTAGFTAVKIGKMLLDLGKDAIQAASDLEEVQNVVDVTFGDSASEINAWAKNAITQFGLTETQAKRFASTMGAMLKSSGLAGDEINKVSTDMAGLAADMASFYNLDFDTAFQKIRSGLSGETEPLKQLGINMSVANLEAFALSKGITKAFNEMSQGEQVMLRYQYLMQATADAQGDFARTSDGYANSMRLLESNLESLKTTLGKTLVPAIAEAVVWLNGFLGMLTSDANVTVLDRFNQIDIDTNGKLEEIRTIKEEAEQLTGVLSELGGNNDPGKLLSDMAISANKLSSATAQNWSAFMGAFEDTTGLTGLFSNNTAIGNIEEFASALAGESVTMSKAEAWKLFFDTLATDADAVSKLTGTSPEATKEWLQTMSEAAGSLEPGDAAAWAQFMQALSSGINTNTPEGQKFLESLATQYLALGKDSEIAKQGLADLGFGEDEIIQKQGQWLETCKRLVDTIPGLSSIIDTQTGEVKGGTKAVQDYIDAWEEGQKRLIYSAAYQQKESALNERFADLPGLELDMAVAKRRVRENFDQLEKLYQKYGLELGFNQDGSVYRDFGRVYGLTEEDKKLLNQEADYYERLVKNENEATAAYEKRKKELEEGLKALAEYKDTIGEVANAEKAAAEAAGIWSDEAKAAAEEATKAAEEALTKLADYYEKAFNSTRKSLDSAFGGFKEVEGHAKRLQKLDDQLKDIGDDAKKIDEINLKIADEKDAYTITKMKNAMKSQIDYMRQYNEDMKTAQAMGFSDAFLSQFADGSVESADWLRELVENGAPYVTQLNEQYAELAKTKEQLAGTLTDQQMTVDETYATMQAKAAEAVAALDMEGAAAENAGKTVAGLARGIQDHVPEVQAAVDNICAQLDRLSGWGINIDLGTFGGVNIKPSVVPKPSMNKGFSSQGSGLDNVPYDGFLAKLHQGEAILDAEENKIWQGIRAGQYGLDYDRLGGVMHDSVHAGGNVYLNGKIVGNVISEQQGRSFKSLQRSGWQA